MPTTAAAAPSGGASAGTGDTAKATASGRTQDDRAHIRWIDRWPPQRGMVELGLFAGLAFPSAKLELFQPDLMLPDQGFKPLRRVAPEFGGRIGYYPLRFLGAELEGAGVPARTEADREGAVLWAARAHVIAQLPRFSVTPFVLAGPSILGVVSDRAALGRDVDMGVHFGGGVKVFLNRYVALRFDLRDTLTAKRGVSDGVGNTVELLAGVSVTLNRGRRNGPDDRDKDGVLDVDDLCVDVPGPADNNGCPLGDRDGDGISDRDDACPDTPGVEAYNGCPVPDTDGDGIVDPEDQCVDVPENRNDYEDADGCPEEIPAALADFTGVIEGIYFDTNKAIVKGRSRTKLDHAVEVLTQFPAVRLEISGYTDDRGSEAYNLDLSARRADAVRDYLSGRGVAADRLETRGAGESDPRSVNATAEGRAQNRRIEFKLLSE